MSRSIESDRSSFLEVLLKLIPSEVIAVHIFIQGVMPRVFWPTLVVFLLLVGITPLYLYWAMGVRSRPQLTVSTLSLVVWIYALGQGPFRFMRAPWWQSSREERVAPALTRSASPSRISLNGSRAL